MRRIPIVLLTATRRIPNLLGLNALDFLARAAREASIRNSERPAIAAQAAVALRRAMQSA